MVPPASGRVTRVRSYSGAILLLEIFAYGNITLCVVTFQSSSANLSQYVMMVHNPVDKSTVWPFPLSLAATWRIEFSFSSSGYLDVSVRRVTLS